MHPCTSIRAADQVTHSGAVAALVDALVAPPLALGARLLRRLRCGHARVLCLLHLRLRTGLQLQPNLRVRARLRCRDGFGHAGALLMADPRLRWRRELVRPDFPPLLHVKRFIALFTPLDVGTVCAVFPPWLYWCRRRCLSRRGYLYRRARIRLRPRLRPFLLLFDAAFLALQGHRDVGLLPPELGLRWNLLAHLYRPPLGKGFTAPRLVLPPVRRQDDGPVHGDRRPIVVSGRVHNAHMAAVPVEIAEEETG